MEEILGYSLKLKKKVPLKQPIEFIEQKNGTYRIKGVCPETGSNVCTMMGKENAQKAITSGHKVVEEFSF